ncbi:MAG: M48 family metalloprotease, partial [Myxococcota bacterium]
MIDSTIDRPKEDDETVIEKRIKSVLLSVFFLACVADSPPPALPDRPARPAEEANPQTASTDDSEETTSEDETEAALEHPKSGWTVLDTVYDDKRVGNDQSQAIEAEMGLVEDDDLLQYVRSVGIRLLRHAPRQPFDYEFQIVDQSVSNAFALPGGKIYVSRGLLALVASEDELAGVLGHEITHAAERHSAARIDYSRRLNPFSIGYLRAGAIAAYSREQ